MQRNFPVIRGHMSLDRPTLPEHTRAVGSQAESSHERLGRSLHSLFDRSTKEHEVSLIFLTTLLGFHNLQRDECVGRITATSEFSKSRSATPTSILRARLAGLFCHLRSRLEPPTLS